MIVFKKVKIKEFPGFIIMKKRLSFKNLLNKIYNFTLDGTLEHYGCYLPEKKGFFSNFILKMFFKRISIDEKQVEDLHHPYVHPTESGNRCDIRWVEIADDRNFGLKIISPELMNFVCLVLEKVIYRYLNCALHQILDSFLSIPLFLV